MERDPLDFFVRLAGGICPRCDLPLVQSDDLSTAPMVTASARSSSAKTKTKNDPSPDEADEAGDLLDLEG